MSEHTSENLLQKTAIRNFLAKSLQQPNSHLRRELILALSEAGFEDQSKIDRVFNHIDFILEIISESAKKMASPQVCLSDGFYHNPVKETGESYLDYLRKIKVAEEIVKPSDYTEAGAARHLLKRIHDGIYSFQDMFTEAERVMIVQKANTIGKTILKFEQGQANKTDVLRLSNRMHKLIHDITGFNPTHIYLNEDPSQVSPDISSFQEPDHFFEEEQIVTTQQQSKTSLQTSVSEEAITEADKKLDMVLKNHLFQNPAQSELILAQYAAMTGQEAYRLSLDKLSNRDIANSICASFIGSNPFHGDLDLAKADFQDISHFLSQIDTYLKRHIKNMTHSFNGHKKITLGLKISPLMNDNALNILKNNALAIEQSIYHQSIADAKTNCQLPLQFDIKPKERAKVDLSFLNLG